MVDVVEAPVRGIDLFASRRGRLPLKVAGRRAEALEKLGIESIQDLLQHYPRSHVDRTKLRTIRELAEVGAGAEARDVQVHARVVKLDRPIKTRSGKVMLKGRVGDETG